MYKSCCFIVICSLSGFQAHAESIKESFAGETKVFLNIYGFAADIDGVIGYQGLNYQLDQPFKDTADALDQALMGHLEINKGKWGIFSDIQYVKTEEKKQVYSFPVVLSTKVNLSNLGIYYRAYEQFPDGQGLVIEPSLGVNYTDLEGVLGALGKQVSVGEDWYEYFGGVRLRYNNDSPWNLAAQYTYGTEQTQIAQAYLGYRQKVFTAPVNFRVGYRYVSQDYKNGSFKWDTVQQGPVIGIGVGF
ncbi:hypothetical protein GCM10025882_36500 [Acinetobacter gyllenbergii]|uniref:Outer membrane protein beta-barrel domain-containing protein n=1 Tax=Acinetobacter gyllenbergii CIP 110306 = MTCC 11365 TaxID=1217657 RepID=A0A829HKL1_9GAMM|nr:hypothetical protein [Acinetobacter gyllenbergii]EPF89182.1 hypothetical protein F957_01031 [Acinetobacter gyllenbergii CIP 110306 = MTCC 11365]GMA13224.1 hypothetical protein GCM10025882_36500 [Acinetobacter gyllenbergii]